MGETMSLDGGLEMYGYVFATEFVRLNGKECEGRKVKFIDKNGYGGELEFARGLLKKDDVLTIDEIEVGRGSSNVYFKEHPLIGFNTVMFADLESEETKWLYN